MHKVKPSAFLINCMKKIIMTVEEQWPSTLEEGQSSLFLWCELFFLSMLMEVKIKNSLFLMRVK